MLHEDDKRDLMPSNNSDAWHLDRFNKFQYQNSKYRNNGSSSSMDHTVFTTPVRSSLCRSTNTFLPPYLRQSFEKFSAPTPLINCPIRSCSETEIDLRPISSAPEKSDTCHTSQAATPHSPSNPNCLPIHRKRLGTGIAASSVTSTAAKLPTNTNTPNYVRFCFCILSDIPPAPDYIPSHDLVGICPENDNLDNYKTNDFSHTQPSDASKSPVVETLTIPHPPQEPQSPPPPLVLLSYLPPYKGILRNYFENDVGAAATFFKDYLCRVIDAYKRSTSQPCTTYCDTSEIKRREILRKFRVDNTSRKSTLLVGR